MTGCITVRVRVVGVITAVVVLRATAVPGAAGAQGADADGTGALRSLRVALDNDLIAARGAGAPPDHDYTHGSRVAIAWAGAPRWVLRSLGGVRDCRSAASRRRGCAASALAISQAIYTPRRDAPHPVPGERPYAGWLSVAASAHQVGPGLVRSATVEAGVTGRLSLAKEVQGGVHSLLGNTPQLGWSHQLGSRPGVVLRYDEARRFERPVRAGTIGAMRVRWAGAAGTVATAFSAGADVSIGRGRTSWDPQDPEVERPPRLYAVVGYRQDVILRDAFVEGWRRGAGAARRQYVGRAEVGAGYRWRELSIEYRCVARGREYQAQPAPHSYGAVAVTARWF
jgi:lipid A 3-O-deacylase